jgi:hypothetical protein
MQSIDFDGLQNHAQKCLFVWFIFFSNHAMSVSLNLYQKKLWIDQKTNEANYFFIII